MTKLLLSEHLYSLRELRRHLPKPPPSPMTLLRWATDGKKLPDGRTVLLESIHLGTARKTSLEAYWRFIQELN